VLQHAAAGQPAVNGDGHDPRHQRRPRSVIGHIAATNPQDRLDAVHIKVTLGAGQVDPAIGMLGLSASGLARLLYFCEQPVDNDQPCELALANSGVILRLRQITGHADQSMVKLRPCRRSRLTDSWLAFHLQGRDELRVEADWAGERKMLVASLTSDLDRGAITTVLAGHRPLPSLFSDNQRRFLADCADADINLGSMRILGPVHAVRWPTTRWHTLDVTAERWTLPDTADKPLDFLELSVRVEPQGAEIAQLSLETLIRREGLDPDAVLDTKTHHVLKRLA
jgi:hypothetical protein